MEVSTISHRMIADLLHEKTGQTLTESRQWRIGTALSGIFRDRGISNLDQLVCLLAQPHASQLAQEVVEALLNNESYFFRDRAMFDMLATSVLPELAERRADNRRISVWCAGCSTGQEPLSLAMLFLERPNLWTDWDISILGTDISHKAIATARTGTYTQFEIQRGLGVAQMIEYFSETAQGWTLGNKLWPMLRYEVHNIMDPAPRPADFDLILCRNVLLYFTPESRKLIFDRLAEAITPDGWLMLGAGETVVGQTDRFEPARGNQGLYRPNIEEIRPDWADLAKKFAAGS